MRTAEEYVQLAEEAIAEGVQYDYTKPEFWNKRRAVVVIGRAQVYATLAQAAALTEQTAWWQRRDEEMGMGSAKERSTAIG